MLASRGGELRAPLAPFTVTTNRRNRRCSLCNLSKVRARVGKMAHWVKVFGIKSD